MHNSEGMTGALTMHINEVMIGALSMHINEGMIGALSMHNSQDMTRDFPIHNIKEITMQGHFQQANGLRMDYRHVHTRLCTNVVPMNIACI